MTFEQILLLYIYKYKKLSLDLFGTIELESNVPDPEILKKEKSIAIEGLKFTFDPLVKTDESFIQFYASEKGKIIPLAISDIELQLHQAKQIVNIGNPFDIPGIGKIIKMDDGKLTIQPGFFTIPPISGSGRPVVLRERVAAAPLPKGEREAKSESLTQKQKIIIFFSAVGIVAIMIIWAFIKYALPLFQGFQKNDEVAIIAADTNTTITRDTLPVQNSSIITTVSDSNAIKPWKAIIGTAFTLNTARERSGKLNSYGHNALLETKDSNNYLIYLPLSAALRDTAKKRDSLTKIFAFPVRIEPSNK